MISVRTINGTLFQNIHVNEDDIMYNDLLKYIKIPPHPRFTELNNECDDDICVRQYFKLYNFSK